MAVGRVRFRYLAQPWGPWFVYEESDGRCLRVSPTSIVTLGPWRTDHRYRCKRCNRVFLDGPGNLCGREMCPNCGHVYWVWETWED